MGSDDGYIAGLGYADGSLAVTAMDATNFYVGNATDYVMSMNLNGVSYAWDAVA